LRAAAAALGRFGLRFGLRLPLGGRLALLLQPLLVAAFHGDGAGVLGRLRGLPRRRLDHLLVLLPRQAALGGLQELRGFLVALGGVLFRAGGFDDPQGVARFEQAEGNPGIRRLALEALNGGVLPALEQIELGVNLLDAADGVGPHDVLDHHDVARPRDREIRLGGHDEREGLQLLGDIHLALLAAQQHLAQIVGAALGGDGPQHVGEEFGAETGRRLELIELRLDADGAALALDSGLATSLREQHRAPETDFRGPAQVTIIDGLGGAHHQGEAVQRARGLLLRLRLRGANPGGCAQREKHRCQFQVGLPYRESRTSYTEPPPVARCGRSST
jgi:hypothetical protein